MNVKKKLVLVWRLVPMVLAAWALVEQLRRPARERTWRGVLLGFIPYDLRLPTPAHIRDAYWNPQDHHLFPARPFGVGWAVNLHEVWHRLSPSDGEPQSPPVSELAAA
jgi:hypothetical protein